MIKEISAASAKAKWNKKRNWHAVDLDATLAVWSGWKGSTHIGPPVPEMLARVKAWLKKGEKVKIFTARVDDLLSRDYEYGHWTIPAQKDQQIRDVIEEWCKRWIGRKLEITNRKDQWMADLWDDRARQVKSNSGKLISAHLLGQALTRLSKYR